MTEQENLTLVNVRSLIRRISRERGWKSFYNYHIRIVPECTKVILGLDLPQFKDADQFVALLASWLHDLAIIITPHEKYDGGRDHHIFGAENTRCLLQTTFDLDEDRAELIAECVLRHENEECPAETSEQLIVAMSDSMSHLKSISYFCYHHYFPDKSLKEMVDENLKKLEKDWRNLSIMPEVAELCKKEYEVLKALHRSYFK